MEMCNRHLDMRPEGRPDWRYKLGSFQHKDGLRAASWMRSSRAWAYIEDRRGSTTESWDHLMSTHPGLEEESAT